MRRLLDPAPDVYLPAAVAWDAYETACERLMPADASASPSLDQVLAMPRLEAYYMQHSTFLKANELIDPVSQFRHVPAIIVHGRYDILCPVEGTVKSAEAWPEAKLVIVVDAGHSARESGIGRHLLEATHQFRTLGD